MTPGDGPLGQPDRGGERVLGDHPVEVERASPVSSMTTGRRRKRGIGSALLPGCRGRFLSFMALAPEDVAHAPWEQKASDRDRCISNEIVTATIFRIDR
jgi:hypothetical protein